MAFVIQEIRFKEGVNYTKEFGQPDLRLTNGGLLTILNWPQSVFEPLECFIIYINERNGAPKVTSHDILNATRFETHQEAKSYLEGCGVSNIVIDVRSDNNGQRYYSVKPFGCGNQYYRIRELFL
jgi:hypothetical protein